MNQQAGLPARQAGQTVLILILVMTVALGIGISVVQRSLSDISTASKVEQSSRAFSAAEAGIEKYLNQSVSCTPDTCKFQFSENSSEVKVEGGSLMPAVAGADKPQAALEYPPLAKEEVAHVWLADPDSSSNPPQQFYDPPAPRELNIYWGNSSTDPAALELTLVYSKNNRYEIKKWYFDQIARDPANKFIKVDCTGKYSLAGYQCNKKIDALPSNLMLLRARLLYNSTSQPFAVAAVGTCGTACSLPAQAKILVSTGTAGGTQRKVRLFQIEKVVPPYLDYAIFSAGEINKE